MTPFDRSRTSFYSSSAETIALSNIISEIRGDIGRFFSYPLLHNNPLGKIVVQISCEKSYLFVHSTRELLTYTQADRQTDGRTDRQTDGRTDRQTDRRTDGQAAK